MRWNVLQRTGVLVLFTTPESGKDIPMVAKQLIRIRQFIDDNAVVEIVVWEVAPPVPASQHGYKYRLACVVDGQCVLLSAFWNDVNNFKR
jgi:hypothetical protein